MSRSLLPALALLVAGLVPAACSGTAAPTADRGVLVPAVSGKGALPIGVSAGFFTAATPGQTRVTAQLLPCRGPKPGPMCDVVASFQVSVMVP